MGRCDQTFAWWWTWRRIRLKLYQAHWTHAKEFCHLQYFGIYSSNARHSEGDEKEEFCLLRRWNSCVVLPWHQSQRKGEGGRLTFALFVICLLTMRCYSLSHNVPLSQRKKHFHISLVYSSMLMRRVVLLCCAFQSHFFFVTKNWINFCSGAYRYKINNVTASPLRDKRVPSSHIIDRVLPEQRCAKMPAQAGASECERGTA